MNWLKSIAEWEEDNTTYLSVVFTWQLQDAFQRAIYYRTMGKEVRAGGPAVSLMPHFLKDVAEISGEVDALPHHNPDACFTSRGCIRKCPFCAVPLIEGELRELNDWIPKPVVCDNNLLACSKKHFDKVIDRLKPLSGIDFNQGLDARLLTRYHASRLAELDLKMVRLSWDDINSGNQFMSAYEKLRKAGIPKSCIRVYVLIGYKDSLEDAWFRLRTIRNMGLKGNPMRYQPLDALSKNSYVAEGWTESELRRFMRYWARDWNFAAIPFNEFMISKRKGGK